MWWFNLIILLPNFYLFWLEFLILLTFAISEQLDSLIIVGCCYLNLLTFCCAVKGDFSMQLWRFHKIIQTALRKWGLHQIYGIQMVGFFFAYLSLDYYEQNVINFEILIGAQLLISVCCWNVIVYTDGRVCISILHPPGDDPNGYELASERWSPVHTVSVEWIENFSLFLYDFVLLSSIVVNVVSLGVKKFCHQHVFFRYSSFPKKSWWKIIGTCTLFRWVSSCHCQ